MTVHYSTSQATTVYYSTSKQSTCTLLYCSSLRSWNCCCQLRNRLESYSSSANSRYPVHPQGPMGLSPDGWSFNTPSSPTTSSIPTAICSKGVYRIHRILATKVCIEFTGDLYNSQEERPGTCKLTRTMTKMIST